MEPKINFVYSFAYQDEVHSPTVSIEQYDYESYEEYVLRFLRDLKEEWVKNCH